MLPALTMLLCSVVASAHDFEVDGIYYNISSNEVSVTYMGDNSNFYENEYSDDVVIPETVTYNGKTYSVTSIGYNAFYSCDGLTSITIPNSVTSIGGSAFEGCEGLTSVTIGNSVTSIGSGAFKDCEGLTSTTIPTSVTSLGSSGFKNCISLTNITIPNSVTSIGDDAFWNCEGLTSITIPNSVTSIGDRAFRNCRGLKSITIPNSVTSIEERAFEGCDKLQKIYCNAIVPPTCDENVFESVDKWNCELYVPAESMADYQTADVWNEFFLINEIPTGIEDVAEEVAPAFEITDGGIKFIDAEGKAVAVYSTAGALVEKIDSYAGEEITLDKGVYIVRVGDKAVKVKL